MKRFALYFMALAIVYSCGTANRVASTQTDEDTIDMGYSSASRNSNAFTVSEVTMTQAEEQVYNNIFDYLRNKVPGVEVSNTQAASDRPHIQIRGNRSILGNEGEPLFLVDGLEFPQIEILKPDEIHSVRVLKDSAASSYGSKGANGVILITTKIAYEAAQREREERKASKGRKN